MRRRVTPPEHIEQDGQKLSLTRSTVVRRRKRSKPTPPRTFSDIVGAAELGELYYVQVVRKQPRWHLGVRVDGVQKPIRRQMTEYDFAKEYGGSKYELTLYGPPRRGPDRTSFDQPIYRRLSEPIIVVVPGLPNVSRPSVEDDEDEQVPAVAQPEIECNPDADASMVQDRLGRIVRKLDERSARLTNNADARMLDAKLDHDARLHERAFERERQRETEAREREAQARAREDREREKYDIERAVRDRTLLDVMDALLALRRKG